MFERQTLSFDLSIRAHVLATAPASPEYCLIAYHGYAEAAEKPMDALAEANFDDGALLAPLAPHQFYNRAGEVVGSWMTKFDRERRVEELLEHARKLWEQAVSRWGGLPLFLFGFSQGGANAYRVALLCGLAVRRCFVLGGDQPPEAAAVAASPESPRFTLMVGQEDQELFLRTMENDHRSLAERGYNAEHLSIQGGHDYLPEALALMHRRIRDEV
jgi:predicted esterase